VFLNVAGREPRGTVAREDAGTFREELARKLEATEGPDGRPLGTLVFRPEEIYSDLRNVPPDLLVHFGALAWRSIGGVGYGRLHVRENDTGPDDAPTLLELGGYDVPPGMQGRDLLASADGGAEEPALSEAEEDVIRRRLSGLGYIS
jgi:hypothetical protein